MPSVRAALCDLCVLLLVGVHLVYTVEVISPSAPRGNCSCGGFPTEQPEETDAPLVSQLPGLVVSCDDQGHTTCQSLCFALATATKAKGPEILCNKLVNATELKLSAFYKVCDKPWGYANMTAEEPLCCENSKVMICDSEMLTNKTSSGVSATVAHP